MRRLLDDFTVRGTTGGYLRTDDFLTFIQDAESRRQGARACSRAAVRSRSC